MQKGKNVFRVMTSVVILVSCIYALYLNWDIVFPFVKEYKSWLLWPMIAVLAYDIIRMRENAQG